jgi:hypothetical protein
VVVPVALDALYYFEVKIENAGRGYHFFEITLTESRVLSVELLLLA